MAIIILTKIKMNKRDVEKATKKVRKLRWRKLPKLLLLLLRLTANLLILNPLNLLSNLKNKEILRTKLKIPNPRTTTIRTTNFCRCPRKILNST